MASRLREYLPAALLLLALAALIPFGGDRGYFYRTDVSSGVDNRDSAKSMSLAENLSPAHNFRLFQRVWADEDGDFRYTLYSRFPLGGPALIKLAGLPFGEDLSAKILAARALMLAFYGGAALFAYLAIARLAASRWVALAASTLAFAGCYSLYHSDNIASETTPDLFGAMLTFHGVVVFVQEGRFRQLLIKTCAALLLGWHVYALLLPFIALGFGGEAMARLRPALVSRPRRPFAALASLARSRYLALGAVSLLFGSALLAFNFANDYAAYGGELSPAELPMARSILRRAGGDAEHNARFAELRAFPHFMTRQFFRAGGQALPYALTRLSDWHEFPEPDALSLPLGQTVVGVLAAGGALAGLTLARLRGARSSPLRRCWLPLAALAVFPFCWSLAWRNNTLFPRHDQEAVFYASVPLALAAIALVGARAALGERRGERLAMGAGAAAAALFIISAFHMAAEDRDDAIAEAEKGMMAEMVAMREVTRGKSVTLSDDLGTNSPGAQFNSVYYYLSGSYLARADDKPLETDFTVSRYRDERFDLITPDNRFAFLYKGDVLPDLYRAERDHLRASEPLARGVFDVYADGDKLRYLKEPCAAGDTEPRFFVHVYPADPNDLPEYRRESGFYGVNPHYDYIGKTFDGACVMLIDLPYYPIASVSTGQYVSGGERIWSVDAKPPPDAETLATYEAAYRAAASTEPAARSDWDVYLDGKTITYLKEPCAESDTRGRFLLSVYPANLRDIPKDRRALGHESLNFDFARWGVTFNGKCMVRRALPDYDVERVETGQWIPGGERLWTAEFAVGD